MRAAEKPGPASGAGQADAGQADAGQSDAGQSDAGQSDAGQAGPRKACPSALCQEDAILLGVVTPAGTVAYVQPPTRIGAEFVESAQALGHPERRFRFSSPCVEGACPQWTGSRCAVVDIAIEMAPTGYSAETRSRPPAKFPAPAKSPAPAGLPACVIRHSCRWYAQCGAAACAVCPTVVADAGGTATYRSTHPLEASTAGAAPARH